MAIFNSYVNHGSLNVPIEHHPTIRYMVYNGYYKVMSNIPKMGQLPTPVNVYQIVFSAQKKHDGQVPSSPPFLMPNRAHELLLMSNR